MERSSFKVLFYISRTKVQKNGEVPILMRLTVDGQRTNLILKRTINPDLWDAKKNNVKSTAGKVAKEINHFLETERLKIFQIHNQMELAREPIILQTVKNKFLGEDICDKTILGVFNEHNEKCQKLVGKDFVQYTADRYIITARYLGEFIKKKYKREDLYLREITTEFISDFDSYLKLEKNCQQNSSIKHLAGLKKVIRIALANDWINKDPFANYKFHLETIDKDFLTDEELNLILSKKFKIERIEAVRDIFVFACFTGLAFIDVKQLTRNHIVEGQNGKMWIRKPRQKTGNMCNIPLMDIPMQILKKYENNPECCKNNTALPVLSNQKMNAYLKEVADLCGINKNLTTHAARHTFATSVTLANGVSIESVAKMLGHSNTKMTHHYARVLDKTILSEMDGVSSKFAPIVI